MSRNLLPPHVPFQPYSVNTATLLSDTLRLVQSLVSSQSDYVTDTCSVEKVMVILRDGRKLLGVFRSYDQFGMPSSLPLPTARTLIVTANFLLESTVERLHWKLEFADRDLGKGLRSKRCLANGTGVLLIRGENVVALGEIVSLLFLALP